MSSRSNSLSRLGNDNLRLRIVSSLVLAPAALAITWVGGPAFAGMVAAAGVILAQEWTRMSDPHGPDLAFALTAGAAAGGVIAASAQHVEHHMVIALAWIGVCVALGVIVFWRRGKARDSAFGIIYISAPCVALVWMRLQPDGRGAVMTAFLFAAVWGADIGAYAVGRLVGGPRLAPKVSENKTWAGFIGGVTLGGLAALGAAMIIGWPQSIAPIMLGGLALAAFGMAGDLLESAIKRHFGVKDSGALIPGHGGLLDRVDGLMLATVAMVVWIAGIAALTNRSGTGAL